MAEIKDQVVSVQEKIGELKALVEKESYDEAIALRDALRPDLEQLKADILDANMSDTRYSEVLWEFQKVQNTIDYPEGVIGPLQEKEQKGALLMIETMEQDLRATKMALKALD